MHQTGAERIGVSTAATILGKSRWTVVRLIKTGQLTGIKLGGNTSAWLLDAAEVQALAAQPDGDGETAA